MVPHFMIKWNFPLNVFRKYNKGALITVSNQANYHRLVGFSILHHSMQNAKCQSRGLVRASNGAMVKGEKWNIFRRS